MSKYASESVYPDLDGDQESMTETSHEESAHQEQPISRAPQADFKQLPCDDAYEATPLTENLPENKYDETDFECIRFLREKVFRETPGVCGQPVFRPESYYVGAWCATGFLLVFFVFLNNWWSANWWVWAVLLLVHLAMILWSDFGYPDLPMKFEALIPTLAVFAYHVLIVFQMLFGTFFINGCTSSGKIVYPILGGGITILLVMVEPYPYSDPYTNARANQAAAADMG